MAGLGLIAGLVAGALLLESGPGVTIAQILVAGGGALAGGVTAAVTRRRRDGIR
jgi:hypothetical protein